MDGASDPLALAPIEDQSFLRLRSPWLGCSPVACLHGVVDVGPQHDDVFLSAKGFGLAGGERAMSCQLWDVYVVGRPGDRRLFCAVQGQGAFEACRPRARGACRRSPGAPPRGRVTMSSDAGPVSTNPATGRPDLVQSPDPGEARRISRSRARAHRRALARETPVSSSWSCSTSGLGEAGITGKITHLDFGEGVQRDARHAAPGSTRHAHRDAPLVTHPLLNKHRTLYAAWRCVPLRLYALLGRRVVSTYGRCCLPQREVVSLGRQPLT